MALRAREVAVRVALREGSCLGAEDVASAAADTCCACDHCRKICEPKTHMVTHKDWHPGLLLAIHEIGLLVCPTLFHQRLMLRRAS